MESELLGAPEEAAAAAADAAAELPGVSLPPLPRPLVPAAAQPLELFAEPPATARLLAAAEAAEAGGLAAPPRQVGAGRAAEVGLAAWCAAVLHGDMCVSNVCGPLTEARASRPTP